MVSSRASERTSCTIVTGSGTMVGVGCRIEAICVPTPEDNSDTGRTDSCTVRTTTQVPPRRAAVTRMASVISKTRMNLRMLTLYPWGGGGPDPDASAVGGLVDGDRPKPCGPRHGRDSHRAQDSPAPSARRPD